MKPTSSITRVPKPVVVVDDEGRVLARLIGGGQRVLDCGCGSGKIATLLAQQGCEIIGIELAAERAQRARAVCRRLIQGNLMDASTWDRLEAEQFDVVLLSHVAEHITEPVALLRKAAERVLPGGRLVAAIPNVAYWRVRLELLAGRWDYQDHGILDRTHVHFYTLKTAVELFRSAGLQIVSLRVALLPPSGGPIRQLAVRWLRRIAPVSLFAQSFIFEMRFCLSCGNRTSPSATAAMGSVRG